MAEESEIIDIAEIESRKKLLRKEKLKRFQITDKLLSETLDRLSVEDRYRMLYYYIFNDVNKKADLK